MDLTYRMRIGHHFRRRRKGKIGMAKDPFGKVFHKTKNPALRPLVFSEGLIIHKEVEHFIFLGDLVDPVYKLLYSQRVICPRFFRKAKSNIIT